MTTNSFKTELRDGTPILVRPVGSGDQKLIEMGMEHLSQKSRYMRFFRPVSKLSKKMLDDLTSHDDRDHIAIGALDLTHPEPFPVGVARCIRLTDQPSEAEIAVAIIDSHQGRGLGTILLAAVAFTAWTHGIKTFVATVLTENRSMLNLFNELGATRHSYGSGVASVRVPITGDAGRCRDTSTGAAVRHIYRLMNEIRGHQGS